MRNIPFAFLDEETMQHIHESSVRARAERVDGFAHLAATQRSMRGVIALPEGFKRTARRLVALLEKMMEMSGPNSIANLERALHAQTRRKD